MLIKIMINKIIWFLIKYSGTIFLFRYFNRNNIKILYLHGVMDDQVPSLWKPLRPQINPNQLDKSLKIISKYYTFISFNEAVDIINRKKKPIPYAVAVTFDDGYRNNVKYALPVLKRYNIQPTIFLSVGHIENRFPFWFDRLDFALQHSLVNDMEVKVGNETVSINNNDRESLRKSFKDLRDTAKAINRHDHAMQKELDDIAGKLETNSNCKLKDIFEEDDWSAVLNWDEARKACDEGVSFGSHSYNHTRLGLVDDDSIRKELLMSKTIIEEQLSRPCRHLCYPNGNFDERVVKIARECGYESAVTTIPGLNKIGDDMFRLHRISFPSNDDEMKILSTASGFSYWAKDIFTVIKRKLFHNPST